jgi:hypothetical protein
MIMNRTTKIGFWFRGVHTKFFTSMFFFFLFLFFDSFNLKKIKWEFESSLLTLERKAYLSKTQYLKKRREREELYREDDLTCWKMGDI